VPLIQTLTPSSNCASSRSPPIALKSLPDARFG
jgi:hypothetical protein